MRPALKRGMTRGVFPAQPMVSMMPLLIGIMVFINALALAGALSLLNAGKHVSSELSRTVTIQIVAGDPAVREAETAAAAAYLKAMPGVASVKILPPREMAALLQPWLGAAGMDPDLPLPALIDVAFEGQERRAVDDIRAAMARLAPHARIDEQTGWLLPLSGLLATLTWVGLGIIALVMLAMIATVVLATRGALNTHRESIEVMHLMGATDRQISALFERRSAIEAFAGGLSAILLALLVLLALRWKADSIGSELLGNATLTAPSWAGFAALPFIAALLAALTARVTVYRSLSANL